MLTTTIRVGLADDHRVLRDGLKSVIEEEAPEVQTVVEAASAREFLDAVAEREINVAVVDISMPGMDGLELAGVLKRDYPSIRTIVLTMYQEVDLIERAIRSSVWGYVLKSNAANTVVDAIRSVYSGKSFFDPAIPKEVISQLRYQKAQPGRLSTTLTPRQIEVLRLICDGKTEREIAAELGISFHTAHAHKSNIMQKLGLHSKVDLVRYAVQRNLTKI